MPPVFHKGERIGGNMLHSSSNLRSTLRAKLRISLPKISRYEQQAAMVCIVLRHSQYIKSRYMYYHHYNTFRGSRIRWEHMQIRWLDLTHSRSASDLHRSYSRRFVFERQSATVIRFHSNFLDVEIWNVSDFLSNNTSLECWVQVNEVEVQKWYIVTLRKLRGKYVMWTNRRK